MTRWAREGTDHIAARTRPARKTSSGDVDADTGGFDDAIAAARLRRVQRAIDGAHPVIQAAPALEQGDADARRDLGWGRKVPHRGASDGQAQFFGQAERGIAA